MTLLTRAQALTATSPPDSDTVAVVLHGPDVRMFFKENYYEYIKLVDLATRLDEAGLLYFKACSTSSWQRG